MPGNDSTDPMRTLESMAETAQGDRGDDVSRGETAISDAPVPSGELGERPPGDSRQRAWARARIAQRLFDPRTPAPYPLRHAVAPAALDPADLPVVDSSLYVIIDMLARGGLGRILRARDTRTGRIVAIKEMLGSYETTAERFVREALITANLQHPSIVPLYELGRWPSGQPFYAMMLVEGRPLDVAIEQAADLDARLALVPHVAAIADALAYAHGQRVIHRDLKPHNAIVGAHGETIVIDWGLARPLDGPEGVAPPEPSAAGEPELAGLTQAGSVMGTPGYMPPEQASGEELDERADVYAIGAMLYHVLAGVAPHEGKTTADVIARIIAGANPRLVERVPSVPRDLAAIVDKAMALDRGARYPTARELAEDLRRFLTGKLVVARHYTLGQRMRRTLARHRAIASVVAGAAITLAGVGAWSFRRVVTERDTAIADANGRILEQARRMLATDPPAALRLLGDLRVDGPGWEAARVLAADATTYPMLMREFALPPDSFAVTPDEQRVAVFGPHAIAIADLAKGEVRTLPVAVANPVASHSIVLCDDNRHGFAIATFGEHQVIAFDLDTGATSSRVVGMYGVDEATHGCTHPAAPVDVLAAFPELAHDPNATPEDHVVVAPDGSRAWGIGRDFRWAIRRGGNGAYRDDAVPPGDLHVSPDGAWLVGHPDDRTLVISELAVGTWTVLHDVEQVQLLSHDNLITRTADGRIRLWHVTSRGRAASADALSPRGTWYAGNDGIGRLMRGDPRGRVPPEQAPVEGYATTVAVNEAGDVAAAVGDRVYAWPHGGVPRELGRQPLVQPSVLGIQGMAIRGDGTPISWNVERIIVWSATPRTIEIPGGLWLQLDHGLPLDEAADRAIVRCSRDGVRRRCLVDLGSGSIAPLEQSTADIGALSADGTHAVTASDAGDYLWWDTATRSATTFHGPRYPELAALSRDGRIAVVGSTANAAIVELPRGEQRVVQGHRLTAPITFAPDARTFVDRDGTLVDVATGEARYALTGRYYARAFRDDAVILATGRGIVELPDNLPREPAELSAWIRARITPPASR